MVKLNIGDTSDNGQITIIDEDRICYLVKSTSRGAVGFRTISKKLLEEYVAYFGKNPDATANDARDALCGNSDIDKFEYGYTSTLKVMAQMALGQIEINTSHIEFTHKAEVLPYSLQQIFYGAPGTGKSHTINEITETQPKENVFRTTFHPDSDYSTFVGCYKPTKTKTRRQQRMNLSLEDLAKELGSYYSNEELGKISGIQKFCYEYYPYIDGEYMSVNVTKLLELAGIPKDYNVEINKYVKFCHLFPKQDPDKITYEFVPQTFTKAYLRAWQTEEPVYLVIEEINRGNCAQIFGDLFQLLDRKNGFSEYPIKADNDLAAYIGEQLSKESREGIPETVKSGEELILPPNLFIWATMNTSDQSLFPIDSAFKRRWDWTYMPIIQGYDKETNQLLKWNIKVNNKDYNWWQFLQAINRHIGDITHSEDKKLGFFFCKAENNTISAETFVSKVLFYLWNDVYKDYDHSPAFFRDDNGKLIEFHEYYRQDENHKTVPDETKTQAFIEKVEAAFKTVDPDANPD